MHGWLYPHEWIIRFKWQSRFLAAILQSAEPILNAKSGRREQWPVVRIGWSRGLWQAESRREWRVITILQPMDHHEQQTHKHFPRLMLIEIRQQSSLTIHLKINRHRLTIIDFLFSQLIVATGIDFHRFVAFVRVDEWNWTISAPIQGRKPRGWAD